MTVPLPPIPVFRGRGKLLGGTATGLPAPRRDRRGQEVHQVVGIGVEGNLLRLRSQGLREKVIWEGEFTAAGNLPQPDLLAALARTDAPPEIAPLAPEVYRHPPTATIFVAAVRAPEGGADRVILIGSERDLGPTDLTDTGPPVGHHVANAVGANLTTVFRAMKDASTTWAFIAEAIYSIHGDNAMTVTRAEDPAAFISGPGANLKVDYLGGEPSHPSEIRAANLVTLQGGVLLERKTVPVFKVTPYEVKAVSLGDHDRMKSLMSKGKGAALGGLLTGAVLAPWFESDYSDAVDSPLFLGLAGLGAVAGSEMASDRDQFLFIACERDGTKFTLALVAEDKAARAWINTLHSDRTSVGMDMLPEVDQLVHVETLEVQREQLRLMTELQASTTPTQSSQTGGSDPLDQLERLSSLHAEGALTDDEFAAAKRSLLDRM